MFRLYLIFIIPHFSWLSLLTIDQCGSVLEVQKVTTRGCGQDVFSLLPALVLNPPNTTNNACSLRSLHSAGHLFTPPSVMWILIRERTDRVQDTFSHHLHTMWILSGKGPIVFKGIEKLSLLFLCCSCISVQDANYHLLQLIHSPLNDNLLRCHLPRCLPSERRFGVGVWKTFSQGSRAKSDVFFS